MGRLIDLDDYRNCYIGMDGEYEKWNIDPNVIAEAQPEIIRCRDCKYGEQENDGWWYCRSFGCQVGKEDGSGFCANAERKSDD